MGPVLKNEVRSNSDNKQRPVGDKRPKVEIYDIKIMEQRYNAKKYKPNACRNLSFHIANKYSTKLSYLLQMYSAISNFTYIIRLSNWKIR